MRKILISIFVGLMLICSGLFIVKGWTKINVEGIQGIEKKNQEIDAKISELSGLINSSYTTEESNVKQAANKLTTAKTEYENQVALSNSNGSSYVSNLEKYDIDYLWTKLGNYAKDESVVIKIDVTASGSSSNLYNLNFTVTGTYVGVTDYIYDIENDSKLGFKIDSFKMIAGSGSEVSTSFICKDIPISVGSIETSTSNKNENTQNTSNDNDVNNVNNSNSATTRESTSNSTVNNVGNNVNSTTSNSSNNLVNNTTNRNVSDPNGSNSNSIDSYIR